MQVDEFVAMTLELIIRGVLQAQTRVAGTGGRINPERRGTVTELQRGLDQKTLTRIQEVEFDLAVTVLESSQSGAGLNVGMSLIGGKVQAGSDKQQSAVNRIKFAVPVVLPVQAYQNPAEDQDL